MTGFSSIPISEDEAGDSDAQWAGVSRILGPRWLRLPTLTIGLLGVQAVWSVEMSYAPPYILSLGLSKSLMSLVLLAGPLAGLIVQPLIGVITDSSKSRFGRRRPYLVGSIAFCIASLLLLGFTRNFASIFTTMHSNANNILTLLLAILATYCIDFSINGVMAIDRALLVDTLPGEEQADGNAWAARMMGLGAVAGFFLGNVNLPQLFPFLGSTEIEVISVLGVLFLAGMHTVVVYCVKEKVLLSSGSKRHKGLLDEFKEIWSNIRTLPRVIRQICAIQFFAWIGWFPVLFWTTVYVGELYKRVVPIPTDETALQALDDEANRLGSRAFLYFSLLALFANFALPPLVFGREGVLKHLPFPLPKVSLCDLWAFSHLVFTACMTGTFFTSSVTGATVLITIVGFSWAVTQWVPFALLAEEIRSDYAEFEDGASIQLLDSRTVRPSLDQRRSRDANSESIEERAHLISNGHGNGDHIKDLDGEASGNSSLEEERPSLFGNHSTRVSRPDLSDGNGNGFLEAGYPMNGDAEAAEDVHSSRGSSLQAKAGSILGIHNLSLVFPQFIVSGITAILFAILEPSQAVSGASMMDGPAGNSTSLVRREALVSAGANSVAVVFRLGGVTAAIACVLTWKLSREFKRR